MLRNYNCVCLILCNNKNEQIYQGVLPPAGELRGDHGGVDGAGRGHVRPRGHQARRPGLPEAVQGGGPPDGGGDLQRAGPLPHRSHQAGPDEVF